MTGNAMHSMYPPLPPVEVGEWLRYQESGCPPDVYEFVQVERLSAKLIHADGLRFSREHGALFEVGVYDAYAGRVRKITDADKPALEKFLAEAATSPKD